LVEQTSVKIRLVNLRYMTLYDIFDAKRFWCALRLQS